MAIVEIIENNEMQVILLPDEMRFPNGVKRVTVRKLGRTEFCRRSKISGIAFSWLKIICRMIWLNEKARIKQNGIRLMIKFHLKLSPLGLFDCYISL